MRMGMRRLAVFAGVLALVAAYAGAAEAQTTDLVIEDFTANPGWTLSGLWAVDNQPIPGHSASNSLNYNQGLSYANGGTNTGTAVTATYTLTGLTSPTLEFWCAFATEPAGIMRANEFDTRIVRIYSVGSPATLRYEAQYRNGDINALGEPGLTGLLNAPVNCSNPVPGTPTWHIHTIPLTAAWGDIYVEFEFDTVDATNNDEMGWFIDDFRIYYTTSGGGGGGGGGGGTYTGDGYYDPTSGVWVGFPNGGPTGTVPVGPTDSGTEVEGGSYDANGIYIGSPGTSSASTGEGSEGSDCGLLGLEFFVPLGLLALLRRRRR